MQKEQCSEENLYMKTYVYKCKCELKKKNLNSTTKLHNLRKELQEK